jgi:hypothetical protein
MASFCSALNAEFPRQANNPCYWAEVGMSTFGIHQSIGIGIGIGIAIAIVIAFSNLDSDPDNDSDSDVRGFITNSPC